MSALFRLQTHLFKSAWLTYPLLLSVALLPRVLLLDVYVAPDEGKWIYRSAHFLQAFLTGDLARMTSVAATPDVELLAPAVPTMWAGAAGLAARYWLEAEGITLFDYLAAIPGQTEKIPLDFYPWTRFPTALLTSLMVVMFYHRLAKLLGRPAALMAALLLALDPFFISMSRVIHHDALVTIFITLSLLSLILYRRRKATARRSYGRLIESGVWLGLALLTKPTAVYLGVFAVLFLWLEPGWRTAFQAGRLRRLAVDLTLWGLAAGLTFVLCWPALWAAPVETVTGLLARSTGAISDENNYSLIPWPGEPLPELGLLYYPVNWLFKTTLPALLGLLALLVAWRRDVHSSEPRSIVENRTSNPARPVILWLAIFVLLFWLLLLPADTRDIRYFLPAIPALYTLAAAGLHYLSYVLRLTHQCEASLWDSSRFTFYVSRFTLPLALLLQLSLALIYFPYFVDYWNPVAGGPWLAPRLVKIGSGEGLDQVGRYLSQKPAATELTVSVSFWESFVPFFPGRYTKPHYNEEADYIVIYRRQIQNRNPFPEYWAYFSARAPEYTVSLLGLEYAWLYPGPQVRVVREGDFGRGLRLQGYRPAQWAAQPGQPVDLALIWAGATSQAAGPVTISLRDETGVEWVTSQGPVLAATGPSPVEGHYPLDIPAEMPRGAYQLWVAVGPAGPLNVGEILVRHLSKPPLPLVFETNFGHLITFGGGAVSPTVVSPEQPLELTYTWQARQSIPHEYTTFTHLVDKAGHLWGQVDRVPGDGRWPAPTWAEDEWIVDQFKLHLNPDIPPGRYDLIVGIYNSQTLERLPVIDGDGTQTVLYITTVTVF